MRARQRWIEFEAVKRFGRSRTKKRLFSWELKEYQRCYWYAYWRLREALTAVLGSEVEAVEMIKDWRRMRRFFDPPQSRKRQASRKRMRRRAA